MVNLDNVGVGSVVLNMIESVPSTISGATLWNMVDNERLFAEQLTGDTIGTSIADKYQPGIIALTASSVLQLMEVQGIGTKSVKIGDISITKGIGESASSKMRETGMRKLDALGEQISFYKALG